MPRRWQRRAVNQRSELNELRAELAELRALVAGRVPVGLDRIRTIGDQSAARDEVAEGVNRGQLVPGRQRDDQAATSARSARRTIRPPLGARANAATARSISPVLRISIGLSSTPTDAAALW